jgi:hypothetical protein
MYRATRARQMLTLLARGSNYSVSSIGAVFLPLKSAIRLGNHFSKSRGLMKPRCAPRSLRTETNVGSFGLLSGFVYVRGACLCLRSHATFFGITRPPFTSARVLPSFGSSTPTSAGSAARNPQKFATSLYLNAALRAAFGVSERRAFAIRESRTGANDDSRYREGAGEGAGDASALGSGVGMRTASSYG